MLYTHANIYLMFKPGIHGINTGDMLLSYSGITSKYIGISNKCTALERNQQDVYV